MLKEFVVTLTFVRLSKGIDDYNLSLNPACNLIPAIATSIFSSILFIYSTPSFCTREQYLIFIFHDCFILCLSLCYSSLQVRHRWEINSDWMTCTQTPSQSAMPPVCPQDMTRWEWLSVSEGEWLSVRLMVRVTEWGRECLREGVTEWDGGWESETTTLERIRK